MSENQIRDAKLAADSEPLAYRTREEWHELIGAYRIVGCFLMMYAAVNLLGTLAQLVVMGQTMSSLASWAQMLMVVGTSIPLAIGGLAMMLARSWGAVLAFVAEGLMAIATLLFMAAQVNAAPTTAKSLTAVALVRGTLLHMVIAFLPFAIWRLCRQRGVFGSPA